MEAVTLYDLSKRIRVSNKAEDKATCEIGNVYIVLTIFNYYIFVDNHQCLLFILPSIKAKTYINRLP